MHQSLPTYLAMTGFFAKGAFPEGRREAAGKQTRLSAGDKVLRSGRLRIVGLDNLWLRDNCSYVDSRFVRYLPVVVGL